MFVITDLSVEIGTESCWRTRSSVAKYRWISAVASAVAASSGELGDVLAGGEVDNVGLVGVELGGADELFAAHADSAANTSAPVAHDLSPSLSLMRGSMLPLAVRLEAQTGYRGRCGTSSVPSS
jgi:hypothetical protein